MPAKLTRLLAQGGIVVTSIADAALFALRYDSLLMLLMMYNIIVLYMSVALPTVPRFVFVGLGLMHLLVAGLLVAGELPRPTTRLIAFAALCLCNLVIMLLQPKVPPAVPPEPSETR